MSKSTKLRMIGLEEHMAKVQDIMHKKGAKPREIWPRIVYTDDEDKIMHFEMIYEVKDSKVEDIMRNKKLKNYCSRITTLVE